MSPLGQFALCAPETLNWFTHTPAGEPALMKPTPSRTGSAAPAGYSGTPLSKKLGFTDTTRLHVLGDSVDYEALVGPVPEGLVRQRTLTTSVTLVHLFVTQRRDLAAHLGALRAKLDPAVPVWVSWPKKSSKVVSDVSEDTIREVALPLGFVDIKVCAVSEVWSGLKLSVRKELRL